MLVDLELSTINESILIKVFSETCCACANMYIYILHVLSNIKYT